MTIMHSSILSQNRFACFRGHNEVYIHGITDQRGLVSADKFLLSDSFFGEFLFNLIFVQVAQPSLNTTQAHGHSNDRRSLFFSIVPWFGNRMFAIRKATTTYSE